jgi:hypothetical protein
MKTFAIIISLFCFVSCIYEKSTYSDTFLKNNSNHVIEIKPFINGQPVADKIVNLDLNSRLLVVNINERGKGGGYTYAEEIMVGFYDSVVVVYDDTILATHYNYIQSAKLNNKTAIYTDSNRSLYKRDNYVRVITDESKYKIRNEYTYTFTEQDYLDAQK